MPSAGGAILTQVSSPPLLAPATSLVSPSNNVWDSSDIDKICGVGKKLSYVALKSEGGIENCVIELGDVQEDLAYWKLSVVCYVIGANPPYAVVAGFLRRVWKGYPIDKILQMNKGVFLVCFKDAQSFQAVVKKVGLHFDDKPIVMNAWSSGSKFDQKEVSQVDVWVQFPGLPVKYWNAKVLSKLASQVGDPQEMDDLTAQRNRGGFARILVRVGFQAEPKKVVRYLSEEGQMVDQPVVYGWLPVQCATCNEFGHPQADCRKNKPRKEWKPKVPISTTPSESGPAHGSIQRPASGVQQVKETAPSTQGHAQPVNDVSVVVQQ